MIINHNMNALNAHRNMAMNTVNSGKSMEKLSSGLRINRAGDDAAGLAISEKMRGQIRGLDQAQRNSQDGISMIQTAEGALNETHSILQRMRELATQAANDTNTSKDRDQIQNEVNELTSEINRIGNTTEFNTIKLLDGEMGSGGQVDQKDVDTLLKGLKSWWISGGAEIVKTGFGLEVPDGTKIKVVLDNDLGDAAALVSAKYAVEAGKTKGKGMELELHVNMSASKPLDFSTDKNGGKFPQYVDRVIAHEMTHAIMSQTMNFGALNTWFKEGMAEFAHGADERLAGSIKSLGGVDKVAAKIGDGITWGKDSDSYSAAYMAVKYLDKQLDGEGGIKKVIDYLKDSTHQDKTLSDALAATTKYSGKTEVDFITEFKAQVKLDVDLETKCGIKLSASGKEDDTGSILGKDNGGAVDLNAEDVVKETSAETTVPTGTEKIGKFEVEWPSSDDSKAGGINLQIGANEGQAFKMSIKDMRAIALGISKKAVAEKETNAKAEGIKAATAAAQVGAAAGDTLAFDAGIENGARANDVKITASATASAGATPEVAYDEKTKTVTIKMGTTQTNNTSAKIEAEIQKLGIKGEIDFSKFKVTGAGDFANATGGVKPSADVNFTLAGGEDKKAEETAATVFAKDAKVTNGTTEEVKETALDMSSHASATAAIKVLDDAINKVSTERSTLGAYQNRLEHTINNLGTSSENLTASESRIRDVDMAKEMMTFSKNNILTQAAQAMLAQAKAQPESVLQLLR